MSTRILIVSILVYTKEKQRMHYMTYVRMTALMAAILLSPVAVAESTTRSQSCYLSRPTYI